MDRLLEIEERWRTTDWALNGPTKNSESYACWYVEDPNGNIVAETDGWVDPENGPNAHQIVAAPVDIAWLVEEVKRLRQELAKCHQEK